MWWEACEFRGGNRVQRGKYPGFQMDSKEPFVALGSLSRHHPLTEHKKSCPGTTPSVVALTRVGGVKREFPTLLAAREEHQGEEPAERRLAQQQGVRLSESGTPRRG